MCNEYAPPSKQKLPINSSEIGANLAKYGKNYYNIPNAE
jgi:hypothetical protein